MSVIQELRQRLAAVPDTKRARQVLDHLRIAESRIALVQAMLDSGLEDKSLSGKPTYTQRLRLALESGRIKTPNAGELLADLDRARAGDRAAQERVVAYLKLPGVLDALDDN